MCSAGTLTPNATAPTVNRATTVSPASAAERRSCAATKVHAGSGVPRSRLSWPVSRWAVSPIARLVKVERAIAYAAIPR